MFPAVVSACTRRVLPRVLWGPRPRRMAAKRSDAYETFTHDLLQLADSRGDRGLTHVAMESAGVYWSRCGTFSGSSFRCCSRTRNPSTPRPGGRRTGRELRDLTRYRAFGAEDELLSRIGFRKFSRAPTPTWRQLANDALGASGERSWKRCSPRSKTLRGSPEMSKGLLLDMIARLQLAVERPMPSSRPSDPLGNPVRGRIGHE